jgi:hypothetical protein
MATTPSTSCKDNEKAKQRFERTKPTAFAKSHEFHILQHAAGKRCAELHDEIRAERSTPSSCDGVECIFAFPDGGAPSGHCVVIRRSLHASAERPGRHGRSLAAVDELWPALPTKVVKLYGSYAAYCTSVSVRRHALSTCYTGVVRA